ncbi:MAG: hypothetical protein H6Q25_142 [Bacteroidetes bacterium]|nr:hypothetical protein [Bacteroidota bacterium]
MIDIIINTINRFPLGFVFTSSDFNIEVNKKKMVNKLLNDLVVQGKIKRLSKGRFYKPKLTEFGELLPDEYQIVKDLIEKNGKPIGYITGFSIFNQFGLTTQVPATIRIAIKKEKNSIKRGMYRISFTKQENNITKDNICLLQLLDCLRFFKEIPDTFPDQACKRLLYLLKKLNIEQINTIKKLVLKYNPSTIALLGALLETINPDEDIQLLHNKLNPMSSFKLYISKDILPTQKKWYIK